MVSVREARRNERTLTVLRRPSRPYSQGTITGAGRYTILMQFPSQFTSSSVNWNLCTAAKHRQPPVNVTRQGETRTVVGDGPEPHERHARDDVQDDLRAAHESVTSLQCR